MRIQLKLIANCLLLLKILFSAMWGVFKASFTVLTSFILAVYTSRLKFHLSSCHSLRLSCRNAILSPWWRRSKWKIKCGASEKWNAVLQRANWWVKQPLEVQLDQHWMKNSFWPSGTFSREICSGGDPGLPFSFNDYSCLEQLMASSMAAQKKGCFEMTAAYMQFLSWKLCSQKDGSVPCRLISILKPLLPFPSPPSVTATEEVVALFTASTCLKKGEGSLLAIS